MNTDFADEVDREIKVMTACVLAMENPDLSRQEVDGLSYQWNRFQRTVNELNERYQALLTGRTNGKRLDTAIDDRTAPVPCDSYYWAKVE